MRDFILLLDSIAGGLRAGSVVVLAVAAVLAALAWAVRSRRLNPFGGAGRFVRRAVDPLLAPVDRRLGRTGVPSATVPWWGLLVLLMLCAGAVFVVGVLRDALMGAYMASSRGPSGIVGLAVRWTFSVLQLALLARVIMSWVGGSHTAVGRLATRLTEWFLGPLRRVLPPMGGLDLSPFIAWFLLGLVQSAFLTLL